MTETVPENVSPSGDTDHDLSGRGTDSVPRALHVTCPQGHRLEAPCVLDGRDVVCPYCRDRFLFCYEESEEYEREKGGYWKKEESPRQRWFPWAAVAVLATLVGLQMLRLLVQASN